MNAFEMQSLMQNLSDAELAQVAQSPPVPGAQLIAIQVLDQRKQMRQAQVQQPSNTTVLQDRVAESMPVQQSAAAADPVRAGLASIAQQQQPQAMADGGLVGQYMGDLRAAMPEIAAMMPGPSSPEDWMAMAQQFQGPDRMSAFADQLSSRGDDLREERRRDRWLALARAGLGMMGPGDFWGNVSRGGIAGLEALEEANGRYQAGSDRLLSSQIGLAQAQQARDDRTGQNAFTGYNNRNSAQFEAGLGAAANVSRLRESAADRAAANWRDTNDVEVLANQLWAANEGSMIQDGTTRTRSGTEVPFSRPYERQDAIRNAVEILTNRRSGGRSPDDLNEIVASARAVLQDFQSSDEMKDQAREVLRRVFSGELGNAGSSTFSGSASPSPSGATAPSERRLPSGNGTGPASYDPQSFERGRARFNARGGAGDVSYGPNGEMIVESATAGERTEREREAIRRQTRTDSNGNYLVR